MVKRSQRGSPPGSLELKDAAVALGECLHNLERLFATRSAPLEPGNPEAIAIGETLAEICSTLPQYSKVNDRVVDIHLSVVPLGIIIDGKSQRTSASFEWHFCLGDGVRFLTQVGHPHILPRCTDEFWTPLAKIGEYGRLVYEGATVFTADLPKPDARRLEVDRSAVFQLARDIVLAVVSNEGDLDGIGMIGAEWNIETEPSILIANMCSVMQLFNAMNQHVHRLNYQDSKSRESRKPSL